MAGRPRSDREFHLRSSARLVQRYQVEGLFITFSLLRSGLLTDYREERGKIEPEEAVHGLNRKVFLSSELVRVSVRPRFVKKKVKSVHQ